MRFLLYSIGSIAVSAFVHIVYYKTAIQQVNRVGNIMEEECIYDVVEILPDCVKMVYASTMIPVVNMVLAFFFSKLIQKLERMKDDDELRRVLVEGVE